MSPIEMLPLISWTGIPRAAGPLPTNDVCDKTATQSWSTAPSIDPMPCIEPATGTELALSTATSMVMIDKLKLLVGTKTPRRTSCRKNNFRRTAMVGRIILWVNISPLPVEFSFRSPFSTTHFCGSKELWQMAPQCAYLLTDLLAIYFPTEFANWCLVSLVL